MRPKRWTHIHNLQTRERVSIREEGTEARPTGCVKRIGRAVVIDDLDFGQVREFWKVLERGLPERGVRLVVHGSYGQGFQLPPRCHGSYEPCGDGEPLDYPGVERNVRTPWNPSGQVDENRNTRIGDLEIAETTRWIPSVA